MPLVVKTQQGVITYKFTTYKWTKYAYRRPGTDHGSLLRRAQESVHSCMVQPAGVFLLQDSS